MESSEIPALALVVFAVALAAGLGLFGCLFLITRRLGMVWQRRSGGYNLDAGDAARIGKLVFGAKPAPGEVDVQPLVWGVRAGWLVMTISIISFAAILAGIV